MRPPGARGASVDTVTLRLVVEPYGRVSDASAASATFRDPDAVACIVSHARDIVFPAKTFGASARTVLYRAHFAEWPRHEGPRLVTPPRP